MNKKAIGVIVLTTLAAGSNAGNHPYLNQKASSLGFPALPYGYDVLEPYIDKMTMEIHYTKHHRAYYDNFMKAIAGTEMESMTLAGIFASMSKYPAAVRNNGGGLYNHLLFWENMAPAHSAPMSESFAEALTQAFGSVDEFKKLFSEAGKTRFGSGWAWLCVDASGKLFVSSTPNQDNPLMDVAEKKGTPLLGLDVWEHAYYLKYQNRRPDYIDAFWSVVNWKVVEARYQAAVGK